MYGWGNGNDDGGTSEKGVEEENEKSRRRLKLGVIFRTLRRAYLDPTGTSIFYTFELLGFPSSSLSI